MDGGEPVALEAFARQHALQLTRFAYLVTGDRGRAEDLVQDVLLGMYRRFGRVVDLDDPLRYARRAVVNAHLSWLRRRRLLELPTDRLPERVPATDVADEDAPVWGLLDRLAPRARAVIVLRYYIGCSDREIADVLGCRESSVRSIATRAFAVLRPVLRPVDSTRALTS